MLSRSCGQTTTVACWTFSGNARQALDSHAGQGKRNLSTIPPVPIRPTAQLLRDTGTIYRRNHFKFKSSGKNARIKPISYSHTVCIRYSEYHSEMVQLSYIYARLLDLRQLLHFLPANAAKPPPKRKKVVGSGTCAPGGTGVGSLPKALFFPILLGDA